MVAVKRLNEQFIQGLKDFLTEIQLLSDQEHPNLISLLGYCDEGKEKIIVYEYAERGSLDSYIRHNHDKNSNTLTWLERKYGDRSEEMKKGGYSFTWALKSDSKMSKLDRFLIFEVLISIFPLLAAICLDRRLSDHRPILLRESSVDYGPTPFRVFHSWFTKDGFDNLIADTWNNLSIMETNKISLLRKKFQALKAIIKNWSRDEMLKASAVRHSAQSRISELDKLIDKGLSNNDIINERISLLKDIHDLDKRHSSDLAQKAKIQWAIEGDENSKYFHGIINKKRSQLAIRGVLVDGEWIEDPPKVKNEFLEHFSNRFSMPTGQTINLDSHMFQKISIDQNADLESDVSLEEIKKAVWECGTNKSPGPDGFSFEFIRKYWNIIQHDVVNAVKEFFSSSKFPPGSNSSFITLIPKSLDAKMVKDFRPISLIGSFYKIVAKILSNRLCIVMPDLISDVQTAFISKRQILDGPFILNELISWCKYHKIKAMIFKADFEKAFDSVRWDYLDGVLNNFGFGVKWRGWIQACLSSAMGSILVNGSPSSEFKFIKGIRIDESLTLSHLFYADDAVFIGKWDKANIMGIGTSQEEVDVAANVIGCNTFSSPFNYLGVKVGSSSSRSNFWDEVIAKLSSRLSKWKIKMLSIGGRFTLNKVVLSSLPIYLMSIYKTPVGVLRKMESIRRRFFNGADINENKMSMIGWEKIMVSRKKRGLGISSFFAQNRALLSNGYWGKVKGFIFMVLVIIAIVWRWWSLDNTEKINASSISCSFRRLPRGSLEEEQFSKLIEDVNSVILSVSNDRWIWSLDSSGEFSIKSTRLFIDDHLLLAVGAPTRWVSEVPIKINIMAWKVRMADTNQVAAKGIVGAAGTLAVAKTSSKDMVEFATHVKKAAELGETIEKNVKSDTIVPPGDKLRLFLHDCLRGKCPSYECINITMHLPPSIIYHARSQIINEGDSTVHIRQLWAIQRGGYYGISRIAKSNWKHWSHKHMIRKPETSDEMKLLEKNSHDR
ncbi:RNA-directed DNA polymerase, eukaryota [Tanacetum coccineum]